MKKIEKQIILEVKKERRRKYKRMKIRVLQWALHVTTEL